MSGGLTEPTKETKVRIIQGSTTDELFKALEQVEGNHAVVWIDSYTPPSGTTVHVAIGYV